MRAAPVAFALFLPIGSSLAAQVGQSPLEVAEIVATRYPTAANSLSYIPALTWSGSIRLAELTGEDRWREKAVAELRPFLSGELPAIAEPYRLTGLAGTAALIDTGTEEGLAIARRAADLMLSSVDGDPIAYATGWTDDMYMATSLLARVAEETGEDRYASAIGVLLTSYADRLQRADGLFVHSAEGPVAWGRGNGFAALGMVEALTRLPEDWPSRGRVLESYRRQMAALAILQAEDGSWHQVVDVPTSYRELTVTALTVVAMGRGIREGWLDRAAYTPMVERGWEAVAARVGPDGSVRDACTSTGAGATLQYYLDRPSITGMDDRAGGLVLLAALEVEALRRGQ